MTEKMLARVAVSSVPYAADRLYTYLVPDELIRHKVGVEPVGGIRNGRDCDASKHFLCHTVSPFALFKTYFAMCVSMFSAVSLPAATSLMAVVTGFSQRG